MILLPSDKKLTTNKLAAVFKTTTASYKFYWFISLLQLVAERNTTIIPLKHILIKMICNAWYPINYFKLNFGYSDKLSHNILLIKEELNIPIDINLEKLFNILKSTENKKVQKLIIHFNQQVPHRFLYPWIKGSKNEVVNISQTFQNNCLYRLSYEKEQKVEINPDWTDYLVRNTRILLDFSYWNLLEYLQARNPNVPAIGSKLIKPITRNSLSKQRKFWDLVLKETNSLLCIYSGNKIKPGNYDLDHFIPWSFVTHDQLWNLIPADRDSATNNSKSNKLPNLDKYLDPFVRQQYEAIKIVLHKNPKMKQLEDYLVLGYGIQQIVSEPIDVLKQKYYDVLSPLVQIASNSGFEFWEG